MPKPRSGGLLRGSRAYLSGPMDFVAWRAAETLRPDKESDLRPICRRPDSQKSPAEGLGEFES